ncbi:MAG: hypothetical protein KC620_17850 [Myxococcales bacterium]|nr:hypothetical protein [Myxococcales bacterium]
MLIYSGASIAWSICASPRGRGLRTSIGMKNADLLVDFDLEVPMRAPILLLALLLAAAPAQARDWVVRDYIAVVLSGMIGGGVGGVAGVSLASNHDSCTDDHGCDAFPSVPGMLVGMLLGGAGGVVLYDVVAEDTPEVGGMLIGTTVGGMAGCVVVATVDDDAAVPIALLAVVGGGVAGWLLTPDEDSPTAGLPTVMPLPTADGGITLGVGLVGGRF